ncbi:MAG: ferritin family protein [Planctomycetes bacterium]|nr:ferritin family protein [Planctomycetota bacterium]
MDNYSAVEEVLDFAIGQEVAAHKFYLDLADQAKNPTMRKTFENFAEEEWGHKTKLENMKKGKFEFSSEEIADLKISDYVVAEEPKPGMNYQDALILAMKKEKAAFRFYSYLADLVKNESLSRMFMSLAQEEARHKLRFETEYDDVILMEN